MKSFLIYPAQRLLTSETWQDKSKEQSYSLLLGLVSLGHLFESPNFFADDRGFLYLLSWESRA